MYAYIDRKKKLPVTTLLRAIGYNSDKDIIDIFGLADEVAADEATLRENSGRLAAETEVNFTVGESVKITDGPFSGFSGTVEEIIEDRSKLKVVVVIFGRKTLLELSFTQVTKE